MTDLNDPAEKANELARIEAKMVTLIDAALSSGRPYLLSELGFALGNDLKILKECSGQRLIDFIRNRLTQRFSLVQSGNHKNIFALTLTSNKANSLEDGNGGQASASSDIAHKQHRYHYRFWAAFAVPLASEVRHLDRRSLIFADMSNSAPVPEGVLLIQPDLIPPEGLEHRDRTIGQNIVKWLDQNGLSADEFSASSRARPRITTGTALKANTSVLEHMLDCLDGRQLHSTSLTLDVIKALLRKHI